MKDCLTDHKLAPCPPFAIINPSQIKISSKEGGKRFGRHYNWGFVDSFDPDNSDFTRLHKLVLKYIRKELIETMDQKFKLFIDSEVKAKSQNERRSAAFPLFAGAIIGFGIILGAIKSKK